MRRIFMIPFLFLLSLPTDAAGQKDPVKGISIRLFAAALNKDQGPVSFMSGEARGAAFVIPTLNLSEPEPVLTREIIMISAATPADAVPVPLAKIRLPEIGSDFRVLLVPLPEGGYQPVVIRGDDPMFTNGDFFFINLSTHQMLGRLGTVKLDLKPGAQEIFRPAGVQAEAFFEVKFARREGKQMMPLTNTCWPIVRDNRSFVIFYNAANGRPTYRAVDEFMALPVTP